MFWVKARQGVRAEITELLLGQQLMLQMSCEESRQAFGHSRAPKASQALSCLASLLCPGSRCSRRMAAASFRYGLTIAGAVLLVTGTLCFAWWSDGEVGSAGGARLPPPRDAEAVPSSSSSSSALLRSVSFFCCGIGGILLIFGLLWSVKANARVVSRRYQYHFPRDLQYFTAEPAEKWNCSSWDSSAIPTYEEALTCRPAQAAPAFVQPPGRKEEPTPPLYRYLEEEEEGWQGGRRRSSSDSALFRPSPSWLEPAQPPEPQGTPPPSYENIIESSIRNGIGNTIGNSIGNSTVRGL